MINIDYIKTQIDTKGCVPIAITNVLRWYGHNTSFREVRKICLGHGYNPKSGCSMGTISKVLYDLSIEQVLTERFTVRDMEYQLDAGNSLLLAYQWFMKETRPVRKVGAHMAFIDGHLGNFFNAYNVNGNGMEYKPILDRYLKISSNIGSSVLWVLSK